MISPQSSDFDYTSINNKKPEAWNSKNAEELKKLTKALSEGDVAAWEKLYLHLGSPVLSFLSRLLNSDDDAFDIAQDVFIGLWQNRERIDPEKNIKGYLYTMAKNAAFDFIRNKKRQSDMFEMPAANNAGFEIAPDNILIAEEAEILIRMALETMPAQRRKVFEMSRFEHMSYDEIASQMNLSKRTVENHVYNVIKSLKNLLIYTVFFIYS